VAEEAGLAAIAAVLVFAGAYFYQHTNEHTNQRTPARMGVRMESTPEGLKVIWNRRSALIEKSEGALLTIHKGASHEDLPISLAELQTGEIIVDPAPRPDTLELTIYGAGGPQTSEISTRVPLARQ
jgi:hypothetical protein